MAVCLFCSGPSSQTIRVNEQFRWLCAQCAVVGNGLAPVPHGGAAVIAPPAAAFAHVTVIIPHSRPLHIRVFVPGNIPVLNPFVHYVFEQTHKSVDFDRIGDYEYSVLARALQLAGFRGIYILYWFHIYILCI